jgi:hypothetical protein
MKKQTTAKILAAGMGITVMLTLAVCNNGTEADICECPNGTVHITDDETACCGGDDCNCTRERKNWTLNYGIKLENQSGTPMDRDGKITLINTVLTNINTTDSDKITTAAARNMKIIVERNSYAGYTRDNNIIKISIDSFAQEATLGPLVAAAIDDVIAMNKFNSDTHLAKIECLGNAGITVTKVG